MERRSLLRPLAFAALLFAAVWAAVIVRWQMANRVPNGIDIALYLVALPLGLLLGFVVLRRGFDAIKQRRAAPAPAVAETAPVVAAPDPALTWQLPVLAAGVQLPAGDDAAALGDAAKAQQRVALHAELKDGQGLPLFVAEVAGIDAEAVRDQLPETAQQWDTAQLRTLALAGTLAARLLDEHVPPPEPATTRTPHTVLTLEWLLPASWSEADRHVAQTWLAAQLQTLGWAPPALALEVHPVADGAAALQRLDELNRAFNRATPPPTRLLLASDSSVSSDALATLERHHRLHGAQQPEGCVPGEGAAALLLAAPSPAPAGELARLHRVLAARRERPVHEPQKLHSDTLLTLLKQARERAGLADDAPALLVGDTDMRPSRTSEAMHFAEQALPELPAAETLLPLGLANGDSGAALALALVAMAAQQVAQTQQPALIFSHQDASQRVVVVATPPTADAATPTSNTPTLA